MLARPPRMPVSMTLNEEASKVMLKISSLRQSPPQLASYLADVVSVELERVGSNVARWRIAIGPVASGNISRLLARAARGTEGDTGIDHGVDLILRQARIDQASRLVKAHPLQAMPAIVDQIARKLNATPLRTRHRRQMIHQRAAFWKKREHVAVATEVAYPLHLREDVVVALAHSGNQMGAEAFWAEDVGRSPQDFPIFVPAVRRLHAMAASTVENRRVGSVKRDREDLGPEIFQLLYVLAGHRRRVRQDRNWHMLHPLDPLAQHHSCVPVGTRMGDHADAHAVKAPAIAASRNNIDHLVVRHSRPVHADEIPVGVVALRLAV